MLMIALLGGGAVLAWRHAMHGRPAHRPGTFLLCLLVAGFLAPNLAALALDPAGRALLVPTLLGLFLATGLAACVRPPAD
jgi:hypothetical protein